MTNSLICTFPDREAAAQAFARDRMQAVDRERYEEHLMTCGHCQNEVLLAVTVRGELRRKPRRLVWAPRRFQALLGLAAAAAVTWLAGGQYLANAELRALGTIGTMPPYAGVAVRSTRARGDSLFADGMRLYAVANYDEALPRLTEARARGADTVPTSFFIGVLRLRAREPLEARRDLAHVIQHGNNPYVAEAHFYSAKAWLSLANADSALAHLVAAGGGTTPIAQAARALADSLREAGR
jgi:hypothetical protein